MTEREYHPETTPPKEKYSKAAIFEHLFPGNSYADLPLVSARNVSILFDLYTSRRGFRRVRLIAAMVKGNSFADRESFTHPDRMLLNYYLGGLKPAGEAEHLAMNTNSSITGLVDAQKGEKLGGAATKRVSWDNLFVTKATSRLNANRYLDEPEYIIGVLDKDNQPCAIIHFGAGTTLARENLVGEKS